MIYLFQRLIQNENQWVKPSPGRLNVKSEGEYVGKNGFGHEDWNFNFDFEINGYLYGFSYYEPAEEKITKDFNIAYGIYKNKQWHIVGFYLNAKYELEPPRDGKIIEQKCQDLLELGNDLGKDWKALTKSQKKKRIAKESDWLSWKVKTIDAIPTKEPIPIPKSIYNSKNFRIANPTTITEDIFNQLFKLNLKSIPNNIREQCQFPEGKLVERKHLSRERNQKLIKEAKRRFKLTHGKLFCQICYFNFEEVYGQIGVDFIEGHHTKPVSELNEKSKTKITDIAMVCPNCHRMLHRRRPWLKMSDIRNLIEKPK